MTVDELREVHQARPFSPFTLELVDGQKIRIRHPELLMFSKTRRAIAVASDTGGFKIIDVFLIQSIDLGDGKAVRKSRRSS